MKKTYENPMLQVVSINKSDIIVTSPGVANNSTLGGEYNSSDVSYAPGQRGIDSWYEGY